MSDYNKCRDVRIGLEIFERHGGKNTSAEHDELFAGPADGEALSPEELETLKAAGWFFDEDNESWKIFT